MLNINDRVTVLSYNALPKRKRNTGMAKVCNKSGTIIDVTLSSATNEYYYTIKFDRFRTTSTIKFTDDMLVKEKSKTYRFEVVTEDNIVIARLLDENDTIIAEGHGHIFNGNSAERYAQAASYAFSKLWGKFPDKPSRRKKSSAGCKMMKPTA